MTLGSAKQTSSSSAPALDLSAAAALFLQPLVAALLGVGLLGEAADAALFTGAVLLLGGVALISRGEATR